MTPKRHKTGNIQRRFPQGKARSWIVQEGENAFSRKDYRAAIHTWEIARQQLNPPLALNQALAEAYFRFGQQILFQDAPKAIEALTQAAGLVAGDAAYAYHVGLAEHRQAHFEQAIHWYGETLRRDAGFRRAYYPLALALVQSGQSAAQNPVWQNLDEAQRARLEASPIAGDAVSQGLAEAARGAWDKARALFDVGLRQQAPRSVKGIAHYYLGVIAQREGDADAALEQWEKAFDTGLATLPLLNNLTLAYTLRAEAALVDNRPADALACTAKGLVVQPGHKRLLEIEAQARFEAGFKAAEQGNWQRALNEWNDVTFASGSNARALAANVAIAYEKMEAWVDAAEAWREFARRRPRKEGGEGWLSPEQVARLWSRVSSLYIQAELPGEAIATLQTALKYTPDDPVLGIALARSYISEERLEAAQNQLQAVLAKWPQNVEALALNAEVTEVTRRGWLYYGDLPGVAEWEKVLATGDETYAPLARQRLGELCEKQMEMELSFGQFKEARKTAQRGLERDPNNHFLRARYVYALLKAKAPREEIDSQIALIDLTDPRALHQLVDSWHGVGKDKEAAALLQKAEALKPLDADFFLGVANCAFKRKQNPIARMYLDNAVQRATDAADRKRVRAAVGLTYAENGMEGDAEIVWQALLKEDATYGFAHLYLAILSQKRGQRAAADKHFRQAEKWARANRDAALVEQIRRMRMVLNSPLSGMLPSGFDRTLDPELLEMLDEMGFDDEVEGGDFSTFDAESVLDNLEDYLPQTDRRRRRQQKKGGRL